MRLTSFGDAAAFLEAVEPALMEREAAHSLLLGAAAALRGGERNAAYLAVVRDGDALAAAAMLHAERPLSIASDRDDIGEAAALLARDLAESGRDVASVHGREHHVEAFVRRWSERRPVAATTAMRQRLHALTRLRRVPIPPGELRPAAPADAERVADWNAAMHRESLGETDAERHRLSAVRRLAAGEMYVWVDGEPRTMAGTARPTRHTIAINSVYTPPEHRGRGYATGCVALLSERMLAAGRRACVLFTDLENPTSNAIYARIGYEPVEDFVLVRLRRRE